MTKVEKILIISLVWSFILFGVIKSVQAMDDKTGPTHLTIDEKEGVHYLTLCAGQKWSSGPEKPFKGIATRSDDSSIALGSFLATIEPSSMNMMIEGKVAGTAKVYFDFEIVGMVPKTTSIFEVTVTQNCGAAKGADKKDTTNLPEPDAPPLPPEKWDWPLPSVLQERQFYSGDGPECLLSNDDVANNYDINLVPVLREVDDGNYYLQLGENGSWQTYFYWQTGRLGVKRVTSSNKEVAAVKYNQNSNLPLVISTKKAGFAEIKLEIAILPPNFDKKKDKIQWKELTIGVMVLPTQSDPTPKCTDKEVQEAPVPEPVLDMCPIPKNDEQSSNVQPTKASNPASSTVPTGLTPKEKTLTKQLADLLRKVPNRPAVCTEAEIQRQSRKIAHAFYSTPLRTEAYASCVDCAQDVANKVTSALADEDPVCFKVTKVGRLDPVFKFATHTVAAVGPSCTELNDDWIVLDTWYWAGNVPVLPKKYSMFQHRYRVFTFKDWKYENYVDWGAGTSQGELAK